jgi:hypothetical protein
VPHEGSYTKMRITNSRRDYDLRIIVSSSVLLLFLVHTATGESDRPLQSRVLLRPVLLVSATGV